MTDPSSSQSWPPGKEREGRRKSPVVYNGLLGGACARERQALGSSREREEGRGKSPVAYWVVDVLGDV